MKLLIITQKVDRNDPILGFFHQWLLEFAHRADKIAVICLGRGEVNLPANVQVFSLGKEKTRSRLRYVLNFYHYLWRLRGEYDTVFVHMNQEYVLLAGWWWRLSGKKILFWRNHHAGNLLTNLAVIFCHKIFCTSRYSYTAKFKKNVLMPVGINLNIFNPGGERNDFYKGKILFLARLAPVKKPEILISALKKLVKEGVNFEASFYGDFLPVDRTWAEILKKDIADSDLSDRLTFYLGISNDQTPKVYRGHEIFVNLSSSGMYDKTIFEAMACGCLVLACNRNLIGEIDERFIFEEDNVGDLAEKIKNLLRLSSEEKKILGEDLKKYVFEHHSLELLSQKLITNLEELK